MWRGGVDKVRLEDLRKVRLHALVAIVKRAEAGMNMIEHLLLFLRDERRVLDAADGSLSFVARRPVQLPTHDS